MNLKHLSYSYQLSDVEISILEYLDALLDEELDKVNVRQVATDCYTSTATVVNLAKKFHLSGFSELIFQIKADKNQEETYQNLSTKKIEQFVQILEERDNKIIAFIGCGFSKHLTDFMCDVLNTHGIPSVTTTHIELFSIRGIAEFIPVFVSHSGEDKDVVTILQHFKQAGQPVITFTGSQQSTLAKEASLTFSSNTFSPFATGESRPQFFFGDTLNHFEIIISTYLNRVNR